MTPANNKNSFIDSETLKKLNKVKDILHGASICKPTRKELLDGIAEAIEILNEILIKE